MYCIDGVGTRSPASGYVEYTVANFDRAAPTISSYSLSPASGWDSTSITITLNYNDAITAGASSANTGVSSVQVSSNNGTNFSAISTAPRQTAPTQRPYPM